MQDFTKLKFQFYLGYVVTIIIGILLTIPYFVISTMGRITLCIIEIIWDSFTFMPKALYEFEKAFNKRIGQIKKDSPKFKKI